MPKVFARTARASDRCLKKPSSSRRRPTEQYAVRKAAVSGAVKKLVVSLHVDRGDKDQELL